MSQVSPFAVKDTGGQSDKIEFIIDAYSQMRISGITVIPTPESLEVALSRLENMAAEFESRNICTNYNFEDEPDPNSSSNVIRAYWQAFSTNLAVRLIPDFNKQVPDTLMLQAKSSLSSMSGRSAMERIQQVDYPNRMGRGSGNTLRYNRWSRFYRKVGTVNSCATEQMFIGDVSDFVEHFDSYLNDGEAIASFTIVADQGLVIQSSSNDIIDISYQIKASTPGNNVNNSDALLTIVITTDSGRVTTRQILFELIPRNEPQG